MNDTRKLRTELIADEMRAIRTDGVTSLSLIHLPEMGLCDAISNFRPVVGQLVGSPV